MQDQTTGMATTRPTRQGQLLRALFALAAAVIILAGIRGAVDIVVPILLSLVVAMLFSPIYAWLLKRGAPTWLAIVLMLVFLVVTITLLVIFLAQSMASFTSQLDYYTSLLTTRSDELQQWLSNTLNINLDLNSIANPKGLEQASREILAGITHVLGSAFFIVLMILFFLAEGPAIVGRLRAFAGPDNPQVTRLNSIVKSVIKQFGVRAIINSTIAAVFTIVLLLLGVDFPYMWGVLAFFMGFVPYIGQVIAIIPPAILALAEYGWPSAIAVVIAMIVIDGLAENIMSPMMMSRTLSLSPTFVFVSFLAWTWVLGPVGAILAMPITYTLAAMLGTFPEGEWLANIMIVPTEDKKASKTPNIAGEAQPVTPP